MENKKIKKQIEDYVFEENGYQICFQINYKRRTFLIDPLKNINNSSFIRTIDSENRIENLKENKMEVEAVEEILSFIEKKLNN